MIKPASEFIAEAQKQINCIDPSQAKSMLENDSNIVVLDVREPAEANESKLTGSINIPRGLLEMKIQDHCSDTDTVILIYCAVGGRASLAAARLKEMGFTNVHAIIAKFIDLKNSID